MPSHRIGELRPSQILFSFGVGSLVDLPNLSVMVLGLDDWDQKHMTPLTEERLLAAVRVELGHQVQRLCSPPLPADDSGNPWDPFDECSRIGVPVTPFPQWLRCPQCNLLAPVDFGVFHLKTDTRRPDRTRFVHTNCNKSKSPPDVLPVRFLVACEKGHINDFPWVAYVHGGGSCPNPVLRLREWGVSGSVSEVEVSCDSCDAKRRMRDAFMDSTDNPVLPPCSGRRPHLRDNQAKECEERLRCILLGASNCWFPITLSALYIPSQTAKLDQLVEEHWVVLQAVPSLETLIFGLRQMPQLRGFAEFKDADVWAAIARKKARESGGAVDVREGLKPPEWRAFSQPSAERESKDFRLRQVAPPRPFAKQLDKVVIVERLREVRALIGFTRIDSPGDYDENGLPQDRRVPLSRNPPFWVPATEVRGEGIFVQFREDALAAWAGNVTARDGMFQKAHKRWRAAREIPSPEAAYPGIRYILLHSFAHALMRQISLECGYTAASIRERIYSDEAGGMAGVLVYTGASDSEGTLGGLATLGEPQHLGRHIVHALEHARLCASDPLCAEHDPCRDGISLHGAACHACMFAPETSCECGNRYLDRALLVTTFGSDVKPFFTGVRGP